MDQTLVLVQHPRLGPLTDVFVNGHRRQTTGKRDTLSRTLQRTCCRQNAWQNRACFPAAASLSPAVNPQKPE